MMDATPAPSRSRSRHVIGVAPRSIYSANTEAEAWDRAILMARGRARPTYVFANRRILGITQGFGPFDPRVRYVRFRQQHRMPWADMERMKNDMLFNWRDANDLISDLTNGKFGRTYFCKTNTGTQVANNWYDLWPVAGNPASGSIANTAFTATLTDDTSTGSMNHRGNVSADTKHLLSKWCIATANVISWMLYDRVLVYDLCTFNANVNKVLTNTNTAARYNTAAPGLLPCIPVCAVTGATAANLTLVTYVDQAGNTGHTMPTSTTVTFIPSAAVSSATVGARIIAPSTSGATVPWNFHLPLATGDTGVRSITNFTTSAANTGSFTILLMHPLTDLMMPVTATPYEMDCVFQTSELERIYDGACLSMMAFETTSGGFTLQGGIRYAWGNH